MGLGRDEEELTWDQVAKDVEDDPSDDGLEWDGEDDFEDDDDEWDTDDDTSGNEWGINDPR